MQFVRIASVDDFKNATMKVFHVLGRHIGVFREADGRFRAMEMGCRHQNADLSQGQIINGVAVCPRHGWKYDLRTGQCLWGSPAPLREHACRVENRQILVSLTPVMPEEPSEPPHA
ncbi:MAG TPA: Rieske (2Fe-2S) protein [Candidatus Hydrogenedentes bacterium]|nr:Rieske (2Fe-2S) protein [Candidatus Hydrogenedentota bacterium]HPU96866.1 Rieske (2Fe-2S) protein [Candidatus Hydrogenedentota bacterium]